MNEEEKILKKANMILKLKFPNKNVFAIDVITEPNIDQNGYRQISWGGNNTGILYQDKDDLNLDTYLLNWFDIMDIIIKTKK